MEPNRASTAGAIDLCGDLRQFFRQILGSVRRNHDYPATSAAETYLAALLADKAHPEQTEQSFNRPLTLLLQEALSAVGMDRFERLRGLGDEVLYLTGFFSDHLSARGIAQDYVEQLGARAYATAGRMFASDRRDASQVLDELAENFSMFAALVHDVSDTLRVHAVRSPQALIAVYEQWLRTGSSALAAGLASRGLVPVRGRSGVVN